MHVTSLASHHARPLPGACAQRVRTATRLSNHMRGTLKTLGQLTLPPIRKTAHKHKMQPTEGLPLAGRAISLNVPDHVVAAAASRPATCASNA